MNTRLILELINAMNKTAMHCAELLGDLNAGTPEEKTLYAAAEKLLAQERDNVAAFAYLFNVLTREKAATDMLEYVKSTLAANREANKIIK